MEENNFYENANEFNYQQSAEPPKKKSKVPGIILLVFGVLSLVIGLGVLLLGSNISTLETADPVDVYKASETDQYVYTLVQYMTDPVACYADMESMQFYIAIDEEWNATVVCIHNNDIRKYQDYIDWLYTDVTEGGPEEIHLVGYAQPMDADLKDFVLEGFEENFGEGYVDEDSFEEFFGEYYIQVGEKNGAYQFSNFGILFLVLGFILTIIGIVMIHKKPEQQAEYTGAPVVEKKGSIVLGILGAFFGALLGGLLWTIVHLLGYISGWIGILIVFFAYGGYKLLSKREDKFGVVISIVFGFIMIFAATYLSWGWTYYQILNESVSGYTTLTRALAELPDFLEVIDGWGEFIKELVMGYAFMLLSSAYWLGANGKSDKQNEE